MSQQCRQADGQFRIAEHSDRDFHQQNIKPVEVGSAPAIGVGAAGEDVKVGPDGERTALVVGQGKQVGTEGSVGEQNYCGEAQQAGRQPFTKKNGFGWFAHFAHFRSKIHVG